MTALNQLVAFAEVIGAITLLHAAQTAMSAMRRRLPWEPEVAEGLAPRLAELLRVPVLVVEQFPTEALEELTDYVRQINRTEANLIEGHVSGRVELALYRTEHHRELDADTLENRLWVEHAVRARVGHVVGEEGESVVIYTCPIQAESLVLDLPDLLGRSSPSA